MIVRRAVDSDRQKLEFLFDKVYRECFSLDGSCPDFGTVTEGEVVYVACQDEKLVGFSSFWEPDRFLHFLCVDKDCRGLGIGRKLIETIRMEYSGAIGLKCLKRNTKALGFYQHLGFRKLYEGESEEGSYVYLTIEPIESI